MGKLFAEEEITLLPTILMVIRGVFGKCINVVKKLELEHIVLI
jgi:hypothetical protein